MVGVVVGGGFVVVVQGYTLELLLERNNVNQRLNSFHNIN